MPDPRPPADRERTISWLSFELMKPYAVEPDYLAGWADGRYPPPPLAELLGIALTEVAPGRAVFELSPGEHHYNAGGTVHGGVLSTLIDSACGIACMSMLAPGVGWTTVSLNVSFHRAVTAATGRIRCEGVAVHGGKKIVVADATVRGPDGTPLASGRATCMTFA